MSHRKEKKNSEANELLHFDDPLYRQANVKRN